MSAVDLPLPKVILSLLLFASSCSVYGKGFGLDFNRASLEAKWKQVRLSQGGLSILLRGLLINYDADSSIVDFSFEDCEIENPIDVKLSNGMARIKRTKKSWEVLSAKVFSSPDSESPVLSLNGDISDGSMNISTAGPLINSTIVLDSASADIKGVIFPEISPVGFLYRKDDKKQILYLSFKGARLEHILNALGQGVNAGGELYGGVIFYRAENFGGWYVTGAIRGEDIWMSDEFLSRFLLNSKAITGPKYDKAVIDRFFIRVKGLLPSLNISLYLGSDVGNISFSWLADVGSYAILENR